MLGNWGLGSARALQQKKKKKKIRRKERRKQKGRETEKKKKRTGKREKGKYSIHSPLISIQWPKFFQFFKGYLMVENTLVGPSPHFTVRWT